MLDWVRSRLLMKTLGTPDQEVTIYSTSWCIYCHAARDLFDRNEIPYREIDIEASPGMRSEMTRLAGGRTSVPQIFIGGRLIGGFDDALSLERRGRLTKLASRYRRKD